ncbi:hypothetical protein yrohd0001_11710 [Yersinia rohdei ATCC 43380]|nr:hypothetical protein yrohd0001_11710 [Yersinia rohdei ATCC 43380]
MNAEHQPALSEQKRLSAAEFGYSILRYAIIGPEHPKGNLPASPITQPPQLTHQHDL